MRGKNNPKEWKERKKRKFHIQILFTFYLCITITYSLCSLRFSSSPSRSKNPVVKIIHALITTTTVMVWWSGRSFEKEATNAANSGFSRICSSTSEYTMLVVSPAVRSGSSTLRFATFVAQDSAT